MSGRSISMTVNGRAVTVRVRGPGQTLLELLRGELHLTGAKAGCEMGECGACTVLLDGQPVTSCLVPALAAEGATIETVEGLSSSKGAADPALHPVQAALVAEGAVQCGFCTPGVVLSAVALLREEPHPSEPQIREALAGNLCRCTGYARIIRAVNRASEEGGEP